MIMSYVDVIDDDDTYPMLATHEKLLKHFRTKRFYGTKETKTGILKDDEQEYDDREKRR